MIFSLAPMHGVTDTVFRQIVASCGKPDLFYTEFVPVDALLSKKPEKAINDLKFSKSEKPIISQIWGTDVSKFYKTDQMISKMGFDGIDINMGCPDKSAIKKGACAALILHLRTVSEMSKVPAHWDEIIKAVKMRDKLKSKALIIGNGDVKSLKEAREKCIKYKIDGIIISRGIFENIYLFNESVNPSKVTPKQKIKLLLKHLKLFQKTYGDEKHFALMKKFVKFYVNNFDNATDVRVKPMETKTLDQLIKETKKLAIHPVVKPR